MLNILEQADRGQFEAKNNGCHLVCCSDNNLTITAYPDYIEQLDLNTINALSRCNLNEDQVAT